MAQKQVLQVDKKKGDSKVLYDQLINTKTFGNFKNYSLKEFDSVMQDASKARSLWEAMRKSKEMKPFVSDNFIDFRNGLKKKASSEGGSEIGSVENEDVVQKTIQTQAKASPLIEPEQPPIQDTTTPDNQFQLGTEQKPVKDEQSALDEFGADYPGTRESGFNTGLNFMDQQKYDEWRSELEAKTNADEVRRLEEEIDLAGAWKKSILYDSQGILSNEEAVRDSWTFAKPGSPKYGPKSRYWDPAEADGKNPQTIDTETGVSIPYDEQQQIPEVINTIREKMDEIAKTTDEIAKLPPEERDKSIGSFFRYLFLDSFDNSIVGLGRQVANKTLMDESIPENERGLFKMPENYQPSKATNLLHSAVSLMFWDAWTFALGGPIGKTAASGAFKLATKKAVTKKLAVSGTKIVDNLLKLKLLTYEQLTNKAASKTIEAKFRKVAEREAVETTSKWLAHGKGLATSMGASAGALSVYGMAGETINQAAEAGGFKNLDLSAGKPILKSGFVEGTLGLGIGAAGYAGNIIVRNISINANKEVAAATKAGVSPDKIKSIRSVEKAKTYLTEGGSFIAEAGIFGLGHPLLTGEEINAKGFLDAVEMIAVLKLTRRAGKGTVQAPKRAMEFYANKKAQSKDAKFAKLDPLSRAKIVNIDKEDLRQININESLDNTIKVLENDPNLLYDVMADKNVSLQTKQRLFSTFIGRTDNAKVPQFDQIKMSTNEEGQSTVELWNKKGELLAVQTYPTVKEGKFVTEQLEDIALQGQFQKRFAEMSEEGQQQVSEKLTEKGIDINDALMAQNVSITDRTTEEVKFVKEVQDAINKVGEEVFKKSETKESKEKPKVEEPKVEEPKVEEPKVEEPKVEEPSKPITDELPKLRKQGSKEAEKARELLIDEAMDVAGFDNRTDATFYIDDLRRVTKTEDNADIGDPATHIDILREASRLIKRKEGSQSLEVDLMAGKDAQSTINLLKKVKVKAGSTDEDVVKYRMSLLENYGEHIDALAKVEKLEAEKPKIEKPSEKLKPKPGRPEGSSSKPKGRITQKKAWTITEKGENIDYLTFNYGDVTTTRSGKEQVVDYDVIASVVRGSDKPTFQFKKKSTGRLVKKGTVLEKRLNEDFGKYWEGKRPSIPKVESKTEKKTKIKKSKIEGKLQTPPDEVKLKWTKQKNTTKPTYTTKTPDGKIIKIIKKGNSFFMQTKIKSDKVDKDGKPIYRESIVRLGKGLKETQVEVQKKYMGEESAKQSENNQVIYKQMIEQVEVGEELTEVAKKFQSDPLINNDQRAELTALVKTKNTPKLSKEEEIAIKEAEEETKRREQQQLEGRLFKRSVDEHEGVKVGSKATINGETGVVKSIKIYKNGDVSYGLDQGGPRLKFVKQTTRDKIPSRQRVINEIRNLQSKGVLKTSVEGKEGSMSESELNSAVAIMDAQAEVWSSVTGRKVPEFYDEFYGNIFKGSKEDFKGNNKGVSKWIGNKGDFGFFDGADVSTLIHEFSGHTGRRVLSDIAEAGKKKGDMTFANDLAKMEKWARVKNGKWTKKSEEKFARGFEHYIRTGKAPTPYLREVFERLSGYMKGIYNKITGSSIDVKPTKEVREVFDRLLGKDLNKEDVLFQEKESNKAEATDKAIKLAEELMGGNVKEELDKLKTKEEKIKYIDEFLSKTEETKYLDKDQVVELDDYVWDALGKDTTIKQPKEKSKPKTEEEVFDQQLKEDTKNIEPELPKTESEPPKTEVKPSRVEVDQSGMERLLAEIAPDAPKETFIALKESLLKMHNEGESLSNILKRAKIITKQDWFKELTPDAQEKVKEQFPKFIEKWLNGGNPEVRNAPDLSAEKPLKPLKDVLKEHAPDITEKGYKAITEEPFKQYEKNEIDEQQLLNNVLDNLYDQPWFNLQKEAKQNKMEAQIEKMLAVNRPKQTITRDDLLEKSKAVGEMYDEVEKEKHGLLGDDPEITIKKLWVDDKGKVKTLIDRLKHQFKTDPHQTLRAVNFINSIQGVGAKVGRELKHINQNIFGTYNLLKFNGNQVMSERDQALLGFIREMKNIVSIGEMRHKTNELPTTNLKHITPEEAKKFLEAYEAKDFDVFKNAVPKRVSKGGYHLRKALKIPQKIWDMDKVDKERIDEASKKIDNFYKEVLIRLKDNGVISSEVFDNITASRDFYNPRFYIDKIMESTGGAEVGDPGLHYLKKGSATAILLDPQVQMRRVLSAAEGAIAYNNAVRALGGVITKYLPEWATKAKLSKVTLRKIVNHNAIKEKNIVLAKQGQPLMDVPEMPKTFSYSKNIPTGFSALKFKDKNGRSRELWVDSEIQRELTTSNPHRKLQRMISIITGNELLKTFATRINPEFAIRNMLRDMQHMTATTGHYSGNLGVAYGQLTGDMLAVAKDVYLHKGAYDDYFKNLGGMDFLSGSAGTLKSLYTNKQQAIDQIKGVTEWLGNSSEMITRLALTRRATINGISEFRARYKREPKGLELQEIKFIATQEARKYMDFNNKGSLGGWVDAFAPYFNANLQAFRGNIRAMKDPAKRAKLLANAFQMGAISAGVSFYNNGTWGNMHSNALSAMGVLPISDKEKEIIQGMGEAHRNDLSSHILSNNTIIMTPLHFINKEGKTQYRYWKIPIETAFSVPMTAAKHFNNILQGSIDPDYSKNYLSAIKATVGGVASTSMIPVAFRMLYGVAANHDIFRERPISYKANPKDARIAGWRRDRSSEIDFGTHPFFIRMGAINIGGRNISPARTQWAISQYTANNGFVKLAWDGLKYLLPNDPTREGGSEKDLISFNKKLQESFKLELTVPGSAQTEAAVPKVTPFVPKTKYEIPERKMEKKTSRFFVNRVMGVTYPKIDSKALEIDNKEISRLQNQRLQFKNYIKTPGISSGDIAGYLLKYVPDPKEQKNLLEAAVMTSQLRESSRFAIATRFMQTNKAKAKFLVYSMFEGFEDVKADPEIDAEIAMNGVRYINELMAMPGGFTKGLRDEFLKELEATDPQIHALFVGATEGDYSKLEEASDLNQGRTDGKNTLVPPDEGTEDEYEPIGQAEVVIQKPKEKVSPTERKSIIKERKAAQKKTRDAINASKKAKRIEKRSKRKESKVKNVLGVIKDNIKQEPTEPFTVGDFKKAMKSLDWPVDDGIITEEYGVHNHPVLTRVRVNNTGINIAVAPNSPVKSVFNGVVSKIFNVPGAANTIIMKHNNYFTVFQGLGEVTVAVGDEVLKDQLLGASYDSSNGTSQIHFEIWDGSNNLNPEEWLKSIEE